MSLFLLIRKLKSWELRKTESTFPYQFEANKTRCSTRPFTLGTWKIHFPLHSPQELREDRSCLPYCKTPSSPMGNIK